MSENHEYAYDRIVDHRFVDGKRQFRMKWSRFSHHENTWIPEYWIEDRTVVAAYDRQLADKERRKRNNAKRKARAIKKQQELQRQREQKQQQQAEQQQQQADPIFTIFKVKFNDVEVVIKEYLPKLDMENATPKN